MTPSLVTSFSCGWGGSYSEAAGRPTRRARVGQTITSCAIARVVSHAALPGTEPPRV